MRTLIFMRHAHSMGSAPHRTDLERPLTAHGRRDVPIMARRMTGRGIRPDLIVTSPAVRARATAELVAEELVFDGQPIRVDAGLYEASVERYLEILTTLPEASRTVLVVGHNPTITECVNLLAPSSVREMPSGGVAAVSADVASWSELRKRSGRLLFFDDPGKSGD